jgi:hypothetical protein
MAEGTDTARLSHFIIAALEGALLRSRVQRDASGAGAGASATKV